MVTEQYQNNLPLSITVSYLFANGLAVIAQKRQPDDRHAEGEQAPVASPNERVKASTAANRAIGEIYIESFLLRGGEE
jgi:hypothetical protein